MTAQEIYPTLRTRQHTANGGAMDVNGAKALKRRLGANEADDALHVVEPAPPVFHWTGKTPAEPAPTDIDDTSAPPPRASLFSLLSPKLR